MGSREFPWAPISVTAAALIPIARILANNPGENLSIARLAVWCLAFIISGLLSLWLADRLDRGGTGRGRATVVVAMLAALIYGPLVARTFGIAQPELVILVVAALIVGGWLMARWQPVRQFIMIVPLFLVVHPILEAIVSPSVTAQAAPPSGDLPSLEGVDSPNVYWVVVDGYGREDVLQELGGTLDLADGLRGRGFEVDSEAVVPYAWTQLSLGATLNAAYFPQHLTYRELEPVAGELFRRGPPAFRAFEAAGFSRLLWPGVDWPGFTCEPIDPACLRTSSLAPEDALVSAMTIVGPLRELLSSAPGFIADADPVPAAEEALAIQSSTDGESRYLTVLHLMGLHPPYRWRGSECVPQPGGLLSEDWLPIEDYVAASRCAAAKVLEAIDRILSADPEAVVIVQGDHGPRLLAVDWEAIRSTMSVDTAWYGTLLAAKLPGGCSLGSGNNTVNVFRLVFACLADTEPDLLESRSLHFDGEDAVARVVHP